jgi:hypothetical protein
MRSRVEAHGAEGTCGEALLLAAGDAAHHLVADGDVCAHAQPEDLQPPAKPSETRALTNALASSSCYWAWTGKPLQGLFLGPST